MSQRPDIPIFPRIGNRMVAINPAIVRAVEATTGGAKIIFDHAHEVLIDASLYEVVTSLWGRSAAAEMKELTVMTERS